MASISFSDISRDITPSLPPQKNEPLFTRVAVTVNSIHQSSNALSVESIIPVLSQTPVSSGSKKFIPSIQPVIGRFTSSDGSTYNGELKDGVPHGQGILTYSNGTVYEGHFKKNLFHGMGKLSRNGIVINEGHFKNNRFVGSNQSCCTIQ